MINDLEVQRIHHADKLPDDIAIQRWVDAALADHGRDTELVVRIVDSAESAELNQLYRHKSGPTNILSFPADLPPELELNLLGDLVVCAPVLAQEALEQHKALHDHWAHIIIHGVLHLLGYDHLDEAEAELMESQEIRILQDLNIQNPYQQDNDE